MKSDIYNESIIKKIHLRLNILQCIYESKKYIYFYVF